MIRVHDVDRGVEHLLSPSQVSEVVEMPGYQPGAMIRRATPVSGQEWLRVRETVADINAQIENESYLRSQGSFRCSCIQCSTLGG